MPIIKLALGLGLAVASLSLATAQTALTPPVTNHNVHPVTNPFHTLGNQNVSSSHNIINRLPAGSHATGFDSLAGSNTRTNGNIVTLYNGPAAAKKSN